MRPDEINHSSRKKRYYFDTSNGEVLEGGADKRRYIADGADSDAIKPLSDILRDPDFNETYPALDTSQWSGDELRSYGEWLKSVAQSRKETDRQKLNLPLLSQARRLGIGPGKNSIIAAFGTYSNFYTAVGSTESHIIGAFDDWEIDDFVSYLKRVGSQHRPTLKELRAVSARSASHPKPEYIDARFREIGGLGTLLELAGYTVINRWDESDCVDWGVKFMEANDGVIPTSRMVDYFSAQKICPSGSFIHNKFGKIGAYQTKVSLSYDQEKERKEEIKQLSYRGIKSDFLNNRLPPIVFFSGYDETEDGIDFPTPKIDKNSKDPIGDLEAILGEKELLARYAKYSVLQALFPAMKLERKLLILRSSANKDFITAIKKHVNGDVKISSGKVEHTALNLQVFDYIWPMDEHLQTLRLDDGYYEYLARLRATAQKRCMAQRAINQS